MHHPVSLSEHGISYSPGMRLLGLSPAVRVSGWLAMDGAFWGVMMDHYYRDLLHLQQH